MATELRIKRRISGVSGAPASLLGAELAHNEVDNTLYIGVGDDGSGGATSIIPIGGKGSFVDMASTQTVGGTKTFSTVPSASQDASSGVHLVRKSQLDTLLGTKAAATHSHAISDVTNLQSNLDLKAPLASPSLTGTPTAPTATAGTNTTQVATTAFVKTAVDSVSISGIGDIGDVTITSAANGEILVKDSTGWINRTLAEAGIAAASHTHTISNVTGLQSALDLKAPLASPALSGVPTAPTASAGTNTTQLANTAFVQQEIASLIDAAPGTLNTLNELAAALGDDPNFATTISTSLGEKLVKTANLSDLANVVTARSNLGLGSMAIQSSASVNITGGTISGVVLDGGTF